MSFLVDPNANKNTPPSSNAASSNTTTAPNITVRVAVPIPSPTVSTTSAVAAPIAVVPATTTAIPTIATIPIFDTSGVLPPFNGTNAADIHGRAPYRTTLVSLVDRFATSLERKEILEGYLNHRDALLKLGFTGFQWLDGSFMEDIETTENRAPRDIDVLSILFPPSAFISNRSLLQAVVTANPNLFAADRSKLTYKTDARYLDIMAGPESAVRQTAYWFGLFSHRRTDRVWKGMLEIPLMSAEDSTAARILLASK